MVKEIDGAPPPGQSPGVEPTEGERDSPGGGGSGGGGGAAEEEEEQQNRGKHGMDRVELGSGLSGAFDYESIARLTEMVERMLGDDEPEEEEQVETDREDPDTEHSFDRRV